MNAVIRERAGTLEHIFSAIVLMLLTLALQTPCLAAPGISSTIKTIYVINHAHLDIGFTDTPSAVAASYKTMIDAQFNFAQNHADYKFNIEETWQLEQWLQRTTNQTRINNFMAMVNAGRISIGGGQSTLHSAKATYEEMPRLLWNAARYRSTCGVPIRTVFHDDVPGVAWTYPQVLARSGIQYLICGENLFIGGGFTQPYASYPFYWKAPDGSRVLTWSTRKAYVEAFDTNGYGLPFFAAAPIDKDRLTTSLLELTNAGYPYDALMIQSSFDNSFSTANYDAINTWNATYDNPKFVIATPEDFFSYFEPKYSAQIPQREGNWSTVWDTSQQIEAQGDSIVRNAHDFLPAAQQMWSFASELGLGSYPASTFTSAWDLVLSLDEHSGAGGCWDGYWTQTQVDQNNLQFRTFTTNVRDWTASTLDSGSSALLGAAAVAGSDSIVVYNPLSWTRTDLVTAQVSSAVIMQQFRLVDDVTASEIPYQKDLANSQLIFVASGVPSCGYKRFRIVPGVPTSFPTSLVTSANTVENNRYRVTLDSHGYISSIYDKTAARELVNSASSVQFNRSVTATNGEHFFGVSNPVPDASLTTISLGANGQIKASLRIANASHPIAAAEVILYDGIDRLDITDTADRSQMPFAPYSMNSRYYAMAFPFALTSPKARIDTAAGWLDPASSTNTLQGSYIGSHIPQHGFDLTDGGYGVTVSARDVYAHSFGSLQTSSFSPSTPPTVYSKFIRYGDQCKLKDGSLGSVNAEPGAPSQWNISYALRPHARAFDAVADARFGWEFCTPLVARYVASAAIGTLAPPARSFLSVDAQNVAITGMKKADFGAGHIIRLQELIGASATTVTLHSDGFLLSRITSVTPLENDVQALYSETGTGGVTSFALPIGASEGKTLRVEFNPVFSGIQNWARYR